MFATLDATTRRYQLPGGETLLLTDTVGFVRKLPHHLIEAFKSTLEEVVDDLENIDNDEEDTEKINREELAEKFINAIKEIASKPDNLDNLECYLSHNFDVWMEEFAYNPECLVSELKHFAEMKI